MTKRKKKRRGGETRHPETDMFMCSLALNHMFSCPLNCSSLLILPHSRLIHPYLVPRTAASRA